MWVLKQTAPPKAYQHQVGLLWKAPSHPAVYVMDCHLVALWCWLQHLAPEDQYSLLHIDGHWDANLPADNVMDQLLRLQTPSLTEFLALEDHHPNERIGTIPGICWDNFLAPIPHLRTRLHSGFFLVHQKMYYGSEQLFLRHSSQFKAISTSLKSWERTLESFWEEMKGRRLINIDIDYFFTGPEHDGHVIKRLDHRQVEAAALALKKRARLDSTDIMTIALSPECSGGFGNAEEACRILCNQLEVELPEKLGWSG